MDKIEEKIVNDFLEKHKKSYGKLSRYEYQYIKKVAYIEKDDYKNNTNSVLVRYSKDEEIFLEGNELDSGELKITYIL